MRSKGQPLVICQEEALLGSFDDPDGNETRRQEITLNYITLRSRDTLTFKAVFTRNIEL